MSKFIDSLSDKKWANSRRKRLEQVAFDAWTRSGKIYGTQNGVKTRLESSTKQA